MSIDGKISTLRGNTGYRNKSGKTEGRARGGVIKNKRRCVQVDRIRLTKSRRRNSGLGMRAQAALICGVINNSVRP